ncbi:response regulator [Telluribacter sp. SYSU D00476]|uniref:response regulator n=1 Tax=Telluribacter sp. SYSU D00476 TaxID=2811430 RepID=UPI001FF61050|nr:response regulator [Telluribacter sp. SYSU D00476]
MTTTCLLIDDDADEHYLFEKALHDVNPELGCVLEDNGKKALEKLHVDQSIRPGVIFLDLNMPGMDGKQCLAELKKIDRLKEVPIVIYSTSSNTRDVSETKLMGSAGYMVKPDHYNELVQTLNRVLDEVTRSRSHFFFNKESLN